MPRAPRFIPPDSMVEITSRTTEGAMLFRPSPELNARVLAILARALVLYPIQLHAFVFLSNHWHALATVAHAQRLADFLRYMNGNLSKTVKELVGWTGNVWGDRPRVIPVVDDEAAEGRLAYILAHGTKEGLVASPLDWPGVTSTRALATGEGLTGVWRDRAKARRASKRSAMCAAESADTVYDIELTPLPAWSHLPEDERQRRVNAMIATTVAEHDGRAHVGVSTILTQDPTAVPSSFVPRPAPLVHASQSDSARRFLEARIAFLVAYYEASAHAQQPALDLASRYPPGAIPPRPPMSPRIARRPVRADDRERGLAC
jgi:hypothetical protein